MWARCRAVAVAQVLEYGIAAHSVIIGIALGVSPSPCTIRPLAAALVFHRESLTSLCHENDCLRFFC